MELSEFQEISNEKRNFKNLNYCILCNKNFLNFNGLSIHCKFIHKIKITDYIIKYILNGKIPLCKCGCGNFSKWYQNGYQDYLSGHFSKTKFFKNPWSKKGRIPANKKIFSDSDKLLIKNLFINEHKTISDISKNFKCSINPIKAFLRESFDNLDEYYKIVHANNSWRKINIPELNKKMRIAASKGAVAFSKYYNTNIEILMKKYLQELKIVYKFQYRLSDKKNCYNFDFFIPSLNLLIECDGDYWHGNPKFYNQLNETQILNKQKDLRKNDFVKKNNLNLIRFWETDICQPVFFNTLKNILCK